MSGSSLSRSIMYPPWQRLLDNKINWWTKKNLAGPKTSSALGWGGGVLNSGFWFIWMRWDKYWFRRHFLEDVILNYVVRFGGVYAQEQDTPLRNVQPTKTGSIQSTTQLWIVFITRCLILKSLGWRHNLIILNIAYNLCSYFIEFFLLGDFMGDLYGRILPYFLFD